MIKAMIVNEVVKARIRNDGGPLVKLSFELDGNTGTELLCPFDAKFFKLDIELNGGKILSEEKINC